jgi:polysaccharide export outer membrane protein
MGTRLGFRTFVLAACVLAMAARLPAEQSNLNPRIAQRDQLSIVVVGFKEFTNKYAVAVDGAIEFPELGRLVVAGLTTREVSELIVRRLKEARILLSPQVTVELEQTATKKVTVNGAVRTQGPVAYAGEITLLEAIVRAGGRLPEAADTVLVVRAASLQNGGAGSEKTPSSPMVEVNVRELENGILTGNIVLQDGDAVFVRKAQAVTITGHVRNVGAYNIEAGSNVEQALALAGGVTERGNPNRIEITRTVDGKTVTLKKVKKTDPVKPGDIIKVLPRII